jgi:hypothetical protein
MVPRKFRAKQDAPTIAPPVPDSGPDHFVRILPLETFLVRVLSVVLHSTDAVPVKVRIINAGPGHDLARYI